MREEYFAGKTFAVFQGDSARRAPVHSITYSALISACSKSILPESALQFFEEIRQDRLQPKVSPTVLQLAHAERVLCRRDLRRSSRRCGKTDCRNRGNVTRHHGIRVRVASPNPASCSFGHCLVSTHQARQLRCSWLATRAGGGLCHKAGLRLDG